MAWPKLRNKSSGPLMAEGNPSGAAHDGARSQGKEAVGAPEGPARLPFLRAQGPRRAEAAGGAGGSRPVRDAPVRVALVFLGVFWYLGSWKLGLTLAIVAIIADTIYRAGKSSAGKIRLNAAQRRTRRQLTKLGRAGYLAMHARPIPESQDQIDHLVVGPAGVFAIDSENWDKRLAVRTKSGKQLWHGPFSKKDRLQHAQWAAQRAADLLSGALGKPVIVRPAMAVYGPRIPWDVATIREVDVFSGPRLRKYLRRRARQGEVRPLTDEEIERIFKAANEAFPHHLSVGSPAR